MKNSDEFSDSLPSVTKSPGKCEKCGAIARLHTGVCVSCLLSEGLEAGDEVSRAVFESVIAEVDVPDKQWRLGDYEILDEIGRGGMGVIYLARQRHPQRIVAVKRVLNYHADSHETLMRFRREADAAASLDHPNILPIYEVSESEDGLPFFSMKFATGGSLQKLGPTLRAKPRRCVQLMAKVARAVEYAHGHGILHRDLKPGNILLDDRGEPLVSDFGLAKWLDANKDLTKSLTIFGTPGYTAPEQAEGKAAELTPAADVYSLGAILFDLLTGRPPFLGSNALSVIRQASETPAPKLRSFARSHGRDLETICAHCLERDPKARYQSAGDLATDLERWLDGRPIVARPVSVATRLGRWSRRNPKLIATSAVCLLFGAAIMWLFRGELAEMLPAAPEKSIAVLPFQDLSRDPDNAFFADGVQAEILTRLSKIADLKVISRTSTQHYKSAPENLPEIARQLGVAHILEGSVQKSGDAVRVNVQLIKAANDSHLWAETFDRKLTDIFSVETEVAKAIADTLQAKLTGAEKELIAAQPTSDMTAYELYLKGRSLWDKRSGDNILKAIGFYEQAIARDPNYALAYAGLAEAYILLPGYTATASREANPKAKAAALKALQLDETLAEAHTALAEALLYGDLNMAGSISEFQRAIALNPNYATAHHWYGGDPLAALGRFDEAIAEGKRAVELDPLSTIINADLGWIFIQARRYDEAIAQLRKTLEIDPTFYYAHYRLGMAFQLKGDLPAAIAEYTKAQQLSDDLFVPVLLAAAKAQSGDKEAAVRMLAELEALSHHGYVHPYWRALLYLSAENRDESIRWLEQSIADHEGADIAAIKVDPLLDPLRGDPRFEALVQKVVGAEHK